MSKNPESSSERLQENSAEKVELKNLERAKNTEKEPTKAELEQGEKDLALKHEAAEKKLTAEKEKRELEHSKEKEKIKAEKNEEIPEKKDPSSYTPDQKKAVYKKEISKAQAQLSRGSRAFSKVIHNTAVEKVSDAAGKTVFRPSALIGGAVTGLVLGILVYIVARYYGYAIPGLFLSLLLVVGAVLGVIVEFVVGLFRRKEEVS